MAKPAMLLLLVGAHALVPTPAARHPTKLHSTKQDNVVETAGRAGLMSAATVAAAAVNQAVSMTVLDAPDVGRSYVALRDDKDGATDAETGLPLSYDKDRIQQYWLKQGSALQQRWGEFLRLSVPFLLKTATLLVQGGVDALQENDAELARDARVICEQLGPTFIKLAQTLSVRPDVLPPSALAELAVLQDSVVPFETDVAIDIIEKELGGPLGAFFSTISEEPVAAASLAQVYKAQLDDGRSVAVKVQRPQILEQVSKDLYVLRRAAEVYQRLIDRFAPQQKTNYVDLLNEWAVGFYTELDFRSEIDNLNAIRDVLVRVEISQWSAPLTWTTSRRWRGGRRFDFRAGARRGRARGAARRARRRRRRHDCRRRLRPLRTGRIMHG